MNQLVRFDTSALNRALLGFDEIFNNFEKISNFGLNNNFLSKNKFHDN